MKKASKLIYLICIILCISTLLLTSCDTLSSANPTVTREEWIAAFDLSKYDNITITSDEMLGENGVVWKIKGSAKVANGKISYDYVVTEDGETEKYTDSAEGKLNSLSEIPSMCAPLIFEYFEESASYGYTMFTYNESTKTYRVSNLDIDGTPCQVDVKFANGKIVEFTCIGYNPDQEIDSKFTISYN